jgi:hypothetical protein
MPQMSSANFLLSLVLCFVSLVQGGNLLAQEDSTNNKRKFPSTQNDTWYYGSEPENHFAIDSSILKLQYYNQLQREAIEFVNAGNTGSAAFPSVFFHDKSSGFNPGFNQFDFYRFKKDSIKYYQVIRPYTELNMLIGLKNEQMFKAKFANQHNRIISYGIDFRRIFSKGTYANQRVNNNGFSIYGIYNSKNQHWSVQTDLIFNSFKNQENGGLTEDIFRRDTATNYFSKTLVPVRNTSAENNYQQVDFYLKTSYSIGKKYIEPSTDSLPRKKLMQLFRVSYQFNVEKNKYKFRDYNPDSAAYPLFYISRDSVYNDFEYLKIGNNISMEYHARKLLADSTVSEKNFIAGAEAGYNYYLSKTNRLKDNFGNLHVTGYIRSNPLAQQKYFYKASATYFPQGNNANDMLVDVLGGYSFEEYGTVQASAAYQLKQAPYFFEHYKSHASSWEYEFPQTHIFSTSFIYSLPKYGITADASYYHVRNLPIFAGQANPYNWTNDEHVVVAHVSNRNGFSGFHIDNDVWYSYIPKTGYLLSVFPTLVTKHSVYYERRVFKKALWFATGFDLRFSYGNTPPYYEPFTGLFLPAYNPQARYYPLLDFFLNFKIKTVRVMLKVDNISSVFGTKGYYPLHNYAAADLSFKAMVCWRFFE